MTDQQFGGARPNSFFLRRWVVIIAAAISLLLTDVVGGERLKIVWPTPSTAWAEGRPPREYLQHAGSGEWESGGFGGVRSGGNQFHEGIDIRPVARDRRGGPTDEIFAAMAGTVRHVSSRPGNR